MEDALGKKVRKPYTITKSRESWTDEEHDKFFEAIHLFDRDWKKIEGFVATKTVIQIRSHAQKYFLKVQKNGTIAHVPPPRPKRKSSHPYPQKASKNVLAPLQEPMVYSLSFNKLPSGYSLWDDTPILTNSGSSDIVPSQDTDLSGIETEVAVPKGVTAIGNSSASGSESSRSLPSCEGPYQGKQAAVVHGIPDFAVVYNFIGSVFDPESKGHVQKLKEMDPINVETVLLLMRNLTVNLSSSDFKPIKTVLASLCDNHATFVDPAVGSAEVQDTDTVSLS
ncbi:hypothetical protein QQ045_026311 [Rhodiola kirilowii]